MKGHATFFWQFLTRNRETGAVAPSSRRLARRLVKHIGTERPDGPVKIFEAGPGTGVVTREVCRLLQPDDRFVVYEANEKFVGFLQELFATDPDFARVKDQVRLVAGYAQDCDEHDFDHAVCGIPFTNFDGAVVKDIFDSIFERLRPGGTFSYFEYWGMRRLRAVTSSRKTRERLKGVNDVTDDYHQRYGTGHDLVLLNLPPATAHHCQKPDPASE